MTVSFPLAASVLGDLIRFRSFPWTLERFVETSGLASGEWLEAELGPPLWRADCETPPMPHAEARQLLARFALLDGGQHTFFLYSPMALYPQSDPDGSVLGSSAVKISSVGGDNKSLALKGLPANYALTIGDMVAVDYGSPTRRALYILGASGNANGSGVTSALEVRPYVRPGTAADGNAYLARPAAKVKLLPGTLQLNPINELHSSISFSVRQTLQAG